MIVLSKARDAKSQYEYGCDLRRLYPWAGVSNPLWGSAIATVRPSESTTLHAHDEDETFIIFSGNGTMTVDADTADVGPGDVIFLPRNCHHMIKNNSDSEPLQFLSIFWGSPEADARMVKMARQLSEARPADRCTGQVAG